MSPSGGGRKPVSSGPGAPPPRRPQTSAPSERSRPPAEVVLAPEPVVDAVPDFLVDLTPEPVPHFLADLTPEPAPLPVAPREPEVVPELLADLMPEPEPFLVAPREPEVVPEFLADLAPEPEPLPVVPRTPEPTPADEWAPPPRRRDDRVASADVPPPRAVRAPWWLRVLAWLVAVPLGLVLVGVPARRLGYLDSQKLLDVVIGKGGSRYLPLVVIVVLWAVLTAILVQGIVEGGAALRRRRARRRGRPIAA